MSSDSSKSERSSVLCFSTYRSGQKLAKLSSDKNFMQKSNLNSFLNPKKSSINNGQLNPDFSHNMEATRQRPAGATSTGDGEPLPGAEKRKATTRHRPEVMNQDHTAGARGQGQGRGATGLVRGLEDEQSRPRDPLPGADQLMVPKVI